MKKFIKENSFYLKTVVLIFTINAIIYFGIKLLVNDYNLVNISLDDKIPFIPSFIYIYMIWYPFLIYSFFKVYKSNKDKYIKLIMATVISLLILYIIFIVYPSKVIRPEVNSYNSVTSFVLYVVYKADTPVNCFPSGHCLLCFILLFNLIDNKDIKKSFKYIAIVINILIIISTLLVKQHVILDVIGAFIIAFINYYYTINTKYFANIKKEIKSKIKSY